MEINDGLEKGTLDRLINLTEGTTKTQVKKMSNNKKPKGNPPSPKVGFKEEPIDKLLRRIEKLESLFITPEMGIYKMDKDVLDLKRATDRASCYDLRAFIPIGSITKVWNLNNKVRNVYSKITSNKENECIVLEPQDRALIPTGIQMDISENHSFRLHPRSGLSLKQGIKLNNSEGVIDNDYVNQLYISVFNASGARVYIEHQDRIAQGEFVKDIDVKIRKMRKEPKKKTDRAGGIGHTGTK